MGTDTWLFQKIAKTVLRNFETEFQLFVRLSEVHVRLSFIGITDIVSHFGEHSFNRARSESRGDQ